MIPRPQPDDPEYPFLYHNIQEMDAWFRPSSVGEKEYFILPSPYFLQLEKPFIVPPPDELPAMRPESVTDVFRLPSVPKPVMDPAAEDMQEPVTQRITIKYMKDTGREESIPPLEAIMRQTEEAPPGKKPIDKPPEKKKAAEPESEPKSTSDKDRPAGSSKKKGLLVGGLLLAGSAAAYAASDSEGSRKGDKDKNSVFAKVASVALCVVGAGVVLYNLLKKGQAR